MNPEIEGFKEQVNYFVKSLGIHAELAKLSDCGLDIVNIYLSTTDLLKNLIKIVESEQPISNYLEQFIQNISTLSKFLPWHGNPDISFFIKENKDGYANLLTTNAPSIIEVQNELQFTIAFFKNVDYFSNNVVAIGANGSGKSSLSNKLKAYLKYNGIVISAQRILLIPQLDAIENPITTAKKLRKEQTRDKDTKTLDIYNYLQSEFTILLNHLVSENIAKSNEYKITALATLKSGKPIEPPLSTNLDLALSIWNSLISHRTIECRDGINIEVRAIGEEPYSALRMSDGEKVLLYLIAQVLLAPSNGFIVIDEPEMYLHKTILKKLWDKLEETRQDCLFIYLTHDLDFATSRLTAKKIWIKSFKHPDAWEIETIPDNEIPELLLMELLGSRKNILFCEGERGSIDDKIYNILFPNFTITPVGGCFEVINYTKTFNKIQNLSTKAYGLIDTDHHPPARLTALKTDNVHNFSAAEVENLLLDEKFLNVMASRLMKGSKEVEAIKKDVINDLKNATELQALHYVNAKIDYYFKDSHVSRSNTIDELNQNYKEFIEHIKIEEWLKERIEVIKNIVNTNNYTVAISIFNNKGIKKFVHKHFKIMDFTERAFDLLQSVPETHKLLREYFPLEVNKLGFTE
jgi:hypothetical protein